MTRAGKSIALHDLLCPTAFVAWVALILIAATVIGLCILGYAVAAYLKWWDELDEVRQP